MTVTFLANDSRRWKIGLDMFNQKLLIGFIDIGDQVIAIAFWATSSGCAIAVKMRFRLAANQPINVSRIFLDLVSCLTHPHLIF